ncbi:hypothetical protein [Paenibacillus flagellatus]|uniref:Uncharacterized protein n=1 Tax=Paenibacillus flagellatus TaxID=2211139 RepID=A0A2V5K3D8_9BACL|nr:hypothetical protein [Paenibacillus flagellatus]PYI53765.1 hypothetical protein DLM86_14465 [Paenibacillus flagellatus]
MRWPGVWKGGLLLLVAAAIAVWAVPYYSTNVFYLDSHKFKKESEDGNTTEYRSGTGRIATVTAYADRKEVRIGEETYAVRPEHREDGRPSFSVRYPSGKSVRVERQSDMLLAYDELGEWVPQTAVYVGDRRVLSPGEERYHPAELVRAAYEEYHAANGHVGYFLMSVALFVYGWCAYRYEAFRTFLFHATYRFWVKDPEPSEMYTTMSIAGAWAVMAVAVWLWLQSL